MEELIICLTWRCERVFLNVFLLIAFRVLLLKQSCHLVVYEISRYPILTLGANFGKNSEAFVQPFANELAMN